jgi:hypothetical protein
MRFRQGFWFAAVLAAALSYAAPSNAQEVIVSARPGLKNVTQYDSAGGKALGAEFAHNMTNLRVVSRTGDWLEVDFGWGRAWVQASEVITRRGQPVAGPASKDQFRGATSGTPAPR